MQASTLIAMVRVAGRGLALAVLCLLSSSAALQANWSDPPVPSVPIMVGGPFTGDNCNTDALSRAIVIPLRAGGFLAVRAAPRLAAEELDRIQPGHPVLICTGLTRQQWVGVLYHEAGAEAAWTDGPDDCGLSETDPVRPSPYRGPCRSGWVARRYLWLAAG